MTKTPAQLAIVLLSTAVSSLACAWLVPVDRRQGQPTSTSTSTLAAPSPTVVPDTATVTPTASADTDAHPELTRVPYPTPGDSITTWNELIDPSRVGAVRWAPFVGAIQASTGHQTSISLSYPSDWIVSHEATHILSFQNEPPESFPAYQGPFVKFEVVWLREQPLADATLPPVRTVLISGDRAILWERDGDRRLTIAALVHEAGTYYGVNGFISRIDDDQYQLYRSLILQMVSTLSFGD